ncbi:TAXI family TRAP transporter solute-binding subunit [Lentibacillus sp. N15]|uniref:TAXI family TRAP transporter solute-binding subunit n=1 Tax=Lentibacillus songyuanensis TaxID=3136161 RepID=UPI0031BA03BC
MKRSIFLSLLILILCFLLAACSRGGSTSSTSSDSGKSEYDESGPIDIQIGSGTQTGNYYPLGAALAKMWGNNVDDVKVSSQATDASVQNLQLMKQGDLQIGFTMLDALSHAYNGTDEFKDNQYKDVRVLAALYPNVGQVVARKGTGVESVADFKGKGFVPGATGSATNVLSKVILDAYGMTEDDVKAQYVGFSEVTDLMKNKRVAGAQLTSGLPTSAIVEILATANGELISMDEEQINALTEKYPVYHKETIPKGTYDEQDKDIQTVGVTNALVVPKDLPEETVYQLTKTMWENIDQLRDSVSTAKNMKLENATDGLAGVPLHPGAKKYYEEKGLLK